jgi:hypothetical protein
MRARTILMLTLLAVSASGPASAAPEDEWGGILGEWTMSVSRGEETRAAKLELERKDGEVRGTWTISRGTYKLYDLEYHLGQLTFSFYLEVNADHNVRMDFSGRLDGSKLTGKLTTPGGFHDVTGVRAQPGGSAG